MLCKVQNEVTSDNDNVTILNCVDEYLSEVEFKDNDNEIDDNQKSDHKVAYQAANKVTGKWLQLSVAGML